MGANKWYPSPPMDAPQWLKEFVRRVMDFSYQQRDTLSPAVVSGTGRETVLVGSTPNTIEGMVLTLNRPGTWVVQAMVEVSIATVIRAGCGGNSVTFDLGLTVDGVAQATTAVLKILAAPMDQTMVGLWRIRANQDSVISATIVKEGSGGVAYAFGQNSSLVATWQGE